MSLTETTAYGSSGEPLGRTARAGGVGRRMKTLRPGGGEEAAEGTELEGPTVGREGG